MISLTIDLTCASRAAIGGEDDVGTIKRVDLSDGGVRLIAILPSLVGSEQANLTAAFLPEEELVALWTDSSAASEPSTIYRCIQPLTEVECN